MGEIVLNERLCFVEVAERLLMQLVKIPILTLGVFRPLGNEASSRPLLKLARTVRSLGKQKAVKHLRLISDGVVGRKDENGLRSI
jgi:hypothetical protein